VVLNYAQGQLYIYLCAQDSFCVCTGEGVFEKLAANSLTQVGLHDYFSCHHGMARPQVADGGRPPDTEGNCEYVE